MKSLQERIEIAETISKLVNGKVWHKDQSVRVYKNNGYIYINNQGTAITENLKKYDSRDIKFILKENEIDHKSYEL